MIDARIPVDGGELAVIRANPGAPRGLVIVAHGFPDHPPTFAPVIEALAARGLDVVAPWLRGYAPSTTTGPFDVDRLGADLLAIADALAAGRPTYLVGHDWGAIATYAALASPGAPAVTAAVTLSVPFPLAVVNALRRDGQWRKLGYIGLFQLPGADRIARARDFALIDRLWRTWSPGYELADAPRAELHACLAASWPAPLEHYRALFRPPGAALARIRRRVAITTPVSYLHGADDGCISPVAVHGQDRWLRGPLVADIIPAAGHFLHVEVPDVVIAAVDDWITAHPGHGNR